MLPASSLDTPPEGPGTKVAVGLVADMPMYSGVMGDAAHDRGLGSVCPTR